MRDSNLLWGVAPTLGALLALGCAPITWVVDPIHTARPKVEAQGPGAVFGSVEQAIIDASIYAHLQARKERDDCMRGGTIYRSGEGYRYEIQVARPLAPYRVRIRLKTRHVARFHIYPLSGNNDLNRKNERISPIDRQSFVKDPLHRPLYILHPSLVLRAYRGKGQEAIEIVDLRHPPQKLLIAGE